MENRRRVRSIGDLSQIYRYSGAISESRKHFLVIIRHEEQRGVPIQQSSSIRAENLRIRIDRLTLMRHDEIMKVYSNVDVRRLIPPLPPLPRRRRQVIKTPKLRHKTPDKPSPSPSPSPPSTPVQSSPSSPQPSSTSRPLSAVPPLKVTNITTEGEMVIVEMHPISKEPDRKNNEEDDDIIYPEEVIDRRPYQIVARYRRAVGESTDFRQNPLLVGDDSTETLVLGLNSFAEAHGCHLIFTDEKHQFDNSLYRAASGVVDFGSVHLLATDSILTANFQFEIDLTFEKDMMQSKEKIEKFVMDFCGAISKVLQCEKNEVRVFSINHKDKIEGKYEVNFGLTSPDPTRTEALARDLQNQAQLGFTNDTILRWVTPAEYLCIWKPALACLKLEASDLAPEHNFDYRKPGVGATSTRGGHPYNLPIGWYRHALRVLDKYEKDPTWIGMVNGTDEWAVAYHGTRAEAAVPIVKQGLITSAVKRDRMLSDAIHQMGEEANRPGVYVATHCQGGSYPFYTTPFSVPVAPDQTEKYCLVFQCRVKPGKFTKHTLPVKTGEAWRFVDSSYIRPYGILLKKEA